MIVHFGYDATFYANEIESGVPFSLVRYGEGEWHTVVPGVPTKREIRAYPRTLVWIEEEPIRDLRRTIEEMHDHPRYWVADSSYRDKWKLHPEWRQRREDYLAEYNVDKVWRDGSAWSRGVAAGKFGAVSDAMRGTGLPLVFVGPQRIGECIRKRFNATFIGAHPIRSYYDMPRIEREVLSVGKPAIVSFGIGPTSKILIHRLFPIMGDSFLIDFGATWEGLCGHKVRRYMRQDWRPDMVRKAWGRWT